MLRAGVLIPLRPPKLRIEGTDMSLRIPVHFDRDGPGSVAVGEGGELDALRIEGA